MTLWGLWYLVSGLASVRRPADYGFHPARTRFAILIAARNEELVIGPLINSLLTQDYPAELYDIWVVPNNCTDNTARAAEQFGAKVLECTVPVKSKGEVLRFAYNRLRGRRYSRKKIWSTTKNWWRRSRRRSVHTQALLPMALWSVRSDVQKHPHGKETDPYYYKRKTLIRRNMKDEKLYDYRKWHCI